MESTYGGRHHDDTGAMTRLADAVTRTAKRGGTVLIPAFAVDRTEVILFRLRELTEAGSIPELPVYVDSPMALRALQVYRRAIAAGDKDVRSELHDHPDPFDTGQLHEVQDVEASKALASMVHPAIIVSASGMATGGRVLHHLARLLPDPRNTVVANIPSFSVHADHDELIDWLRSANTAPETTYLVHGEPSGAEVLHDAIESELDVAVVVPTHLERVRLG